MLKGSPKEHLSEPMRFLNFWESFIVKSTHTTGLNFHVNKLHLALRKPLYASIRASKLINFVISELLRKFYCLEYPDSMFDFFYIISLEHKASKSTTGWCRVNFRKFLVKPVRCWSVECLQKSQTHTGRGFLFAAEHDQFSDFLIIFLNIFQEFIL